MFELSSGANETVAVIPTFGTKQCPRCGSGLFDDMDTCYDCLYEYPEDSTVVEVVAEEQVPTEIYERGMTADKEALGVSAMPVLRILTPDLEVALPIREGGIVVGRSESCDVTLRSRSVSRRHVKVEASGDGVDVMDLGARNRASLNGAQIQDRMHMARGDILDVCGVTFTLV